MNMRKLLRMLPSCLLGAIFVAGIASTTVNAVDGNPPGLFELDGNIPDGAGAGDDWGGLFAGTKGANLITFTGIDADPAPATIFTQGGSKDVNDVTQWKHTNGSVPDKDDITNAYAAAYNNPADVCKNSSGAPVLCSDAGAVGAPIHKAGDLIVYFGLDRKANNGDAFAGFWFFQNEVGAKADGTFSGTHVAMRADPANPGKFLPGDVFVTVQYPQASGARPIIKIYQWDPNDADGDGNKDPDESGKGSPLDLVIKTVDADCDLTGNKLACAITNLTQQASPPWPYTPKSGTGLPFESFFEGGINVTRLLGSTPCFASFLAETRSSSSQTAQLKDFVVGAFAVCGIDVEKDCAADLNQTGNGVVVNFFGTLKNTGGSSFIALLKDDQAGASITDVCVDTGAPGCGDDGPAPGLVLQGDGSAYLTLAPGATVRYEGTYSVNGLPPTPGTGFALNDQVTASAFRRVEDIPNPALIVVSDSDTAGCNYNVTPGLQVTKNCTVAFLAGNSASVTISGTVKNTGDVPLSNVTLTDSDFGAFAGFPATLAKGATESYSKTQSVPFSDLAAVVSPPDANGVRTVTLNHSDTVTANGKVLASNGSVIDDAEAQGSAACADSFTSGIDVQKVCNVALDFSGSNILVRVDVTATVKNLGTEILNGIQLSDVPAITFAGGQASLAGGASFVATGSYFPSTTIGGDNPVPGSASFTDTVNVSGTGAFSTLSATDSNTAVCDLCPPHAQ